MARDCSRGRLNSLVSGQQIQLVIVEPDHADQTAAASASLTSPLSFTQQMRRLLTRSVADVASRYATYSPIDDDRRSLLLLQAADAADAGARPPS